jgi:hypothetical protein
MDEVSAAVNHLHKQETDWVEVTPLDLMAELTVPPMSPEWLIGAGEALESKDARRCLVECWFQNGRLGPLRELDR